MLRTGRFALSRGTEWRCQETPPLREGPLLSGISPLRTSTTQPKYTWYGGLEFGTALRVQDPLQHVSRMGWQGMPGSWHAVQ
jgi:hypothetical protein